MPRTQWILLLSTAFLITPAAATSIRDLAQTERPALIAHITGSVEGVAVGFKLSGNTKAYECVRRWGAPPANGDSKAFSDILTRIVEELGKLNAGKPRVPTYEEVLAAAVRQECDAALPSTR